MTSRPTTASPAGKDRRRYQRRTISDWQLLTVEMALPGSAYGPQQHGIMLNLSESGMGLQPFLPLVPEEFVELRFGLPGLSKVMETKAVVSWAGSGGPTGIQFVDTTAESRDQLRKWVTSDLRLPSQQTSQRALEGKVLSLGPQPNEFENGLRLIARRAMVITRASGVAIALGDRSGMQCRASLGMAPDIGVKLFPDRGLTGHCLSTAKVIHCHDAQADPRVDPGVARELQVGSILIAPVFASGKLSGIIEVLSKHCSAFDQYHIARLEAFASLLGTAIELIPNAPGPVLRAPAAEKAAPSLPLELPPATTDDSSNPLECLWTLIEGTIQGPAQTGFIETVERRILHEKKGRDKNYWN